MYIKDINNTYEEDMLELLDKARQIFASREHLTDEEAFEIISRIVIRHFENREIIEYEDFKFLVRKLFFKTRERLNILKPLIDDDDISEIMVNGHDKIYYEKKGEIYKYNLSFDSNEELEEVMHYIAGSINREINELNPIVDARLPDGSRVNGVYKNISMTGPTLTIRKFLDDFISIRQLIENNTLNEEAAQLLEFLVKNGYNIFISGGTSSGKTTLINAISEYIPSNERVIVIEDSAELKLGKLDNLVQLECRNSNSAGRGEITMSALIKNSLRMRPDRILIGEVRGKEVFDMLQAMNTGHSGMSTGHGNSIEGMLKRLETMYLMAASMDIRAIRNQIAEAMDIMIHLERVGSNRRVVEITEIVDANDDGYELNPLMYMDEKLELNYTGNKLIKRKILKEKRGTSYGL